ncbi:MAG: S8 family serine peptidase [Polyangiaceae bacterium]|nr:S8 family serine peptidase [Polyangiaceae bacterium]
MAVVRKKVGVAVVDGGMENNSHLNLKVERVWDFRGPEPMSCFGTDDSHAMEVAYTVLRAASDQTVDLWSLRAQTLEEILRAIRWGITNHSPKSETEPIQVYCIPQVTKTAATEHDRLLRDSIDMAIEEGVIICISLGNAPPFSAPATTGRAIRVGGFDKKENGDLLVYPLPPPEGTPQPGAICKPDVLAPWAGYPLWNGKEGKAGTSIAAGHAAGRIARLLYDNPGWKHSHVMEHLKTKSHLEDSFGAMPSRDGSGYLVID